MDKKIEKQKMAPWKMGLIAIGLAGGGWFVYQLLADASIRTFRVPEEQLIVSTVQFGAFEDLIPIRGTIQPFESVFLDAVIGGAVEEVFVEEGSFVEAGTPLVQLTNTQTRLSAAQADAATTEQLNTLNNTTTGFEYSKLSTERQRIDTEYRITVLQRQKARFERLLDDSLISEEEYDSLSDELVYQTKVLINLKEYQQVQDDER